LTSVLERTSFSFDQSSAAAGSMSAGIEIGISMSTYALNKLIRDINRSPSVREEYFKDQVSLLDRYGLSVDERQALRSVDIGKLYQMGVHGLILRPFTLLHEVSEPDYLKAIRG
jgi:Aromatic-ring-opening dioxygenase LigAB, LigA subunit